MFLGLHSIMHLIIELTIPPGISSNHDSVCTAQRRGYVKKSTKLQLFIIILLDLSTLMCKLATAFMRLSWSE